MPTLCICHFSATINDIIDKHFAPYGMQQIALANLATHRDYRRRGCGAALCKYGIRMAQDKRCVVTVLGSPLGKLLYQSVGFKITAVEPLGVPGEDEILYITSLVNQEGRTAHLG